MGIISGNILIELLERMDQRINERMLEDDEVGFANKTDALNACEQALKKGVHAQPLCDHNNVKLLAGHLLKQKKEDQKAEAF